MKPWEKYQTDQEESGPWKKYGNIASTPQEAQGQLQPNEPEVQQKIHFLRPGGPSQFSDEPDFGEMPVGEPAMGAKALATPFEPLAQILRSPGAVSEAGLAERPEGLEEKGASILDFTGHAFRGALRQGGASEALIDDITKREDFGDTAEAFGRVVTEYGAMSGYARGAAKLLAGAGKGYVSMFRKGVADIQNGIAKSVRKTIEKTVRPKGAKTLAQKEVYYRKATAHAEDIVKKKNDITLTKKGVEVKGELPETMAQWEQANNQARKMALDYLDISTKAEKLKYQVSVDDLIMNLERFIEKPSHQHGKPAMVKYAKKTLDDLKLAKAKNQLTPKYVEEMIQAKNENLRLRMNTADPKIYHTASVDQVYAEYMNKSLAETIEKMGKGEGSKYRELRRLWGAHKQVSQDISNAATRIAHQQPNMFAKGIETFTGYHALRGALSRNPATFAAAITSKGVNAIEVFLNKPHRQVTKMFNNVEAGLRKIDALTPVIQKATVPKSIPKQIAWDGTFTRSGSGKPIPLRVGDQHAEYTPSGLIKPSRGAIKGKEPKKVETTRHSAEAPGHIPKKEVTLYKITQPKSKEPIPLIKPKQESVFIGKDGRVKLGKYIQ